MQPSPVVTLNRGGCGVQGTRGRGSAGNDRALGRRLSNYFHFFGVRGAFLMQLGRNEEARVAFRSRHRARAYFRRAAHIRMHLDRLIRDSQPRNAKAGK